MNQATLIFFILTLSFNAFSSEYEIVFNEGGNAYDDTLHPTNLSNKYLANVTLYKDDKIILSSIRGSTLPDSAFYYQQWHIRNIKYSPTDSDIIEIFKAWDTQTNTTSVDNISTNKFLNYFIKDMGRLTKYLASVPVIWSGSYKFIIGKHQNGDPSQPHGLPYVPKLRGSKIRNFPYNAKIDNISSSYLVNLNRNNIWIETINKNNAQNMLKVANGINIHDGRRSNQHRDSEGCLTINPDDWRKFISMLPNENDWNSKNHTGIVTINRNHSPIPRPSSVF